MIGRAFFHAGRMLRETGQALDRLGLRSQNNLIFRDKRARTRAARRELACTRAGAATAAPSSARAGA